MITIYLKYGQNIRLECESQENENELYNSLCKDIKSKTNLVEITCDTQKHIIKYSEITNIRMDL